MPFFTTVRIQDEFDRIQFGRQRLTWENHHKNKLLITWLDFAGQVRSLRVCFCSLGLLFFTAYDFADQGIFYLLGNKPVIDDEYFYFTLLSRCGFYYCKLSMYQYVNILHVVESLIFWKLWESLINIWNVGNTLGTTVCNYYCRWRKHRWVKTLFRFFKKSFVWYERYI